MTSEGDRAFDLQDSVRIVAPCQSPQRTRVSPGVRRPIPGGHKYRDSVPWKGSVCLSSPPLLLRDPEHTSLMDTYHYPESSNIIETMKQNTVQDRPHEPNSSSAPGSSGFLLPCLHGVRQLRGALQPPLPLHSAHSEHGSSQQCALGRPVTVPFPPAMPTFICVPT